MARKTLPARRRPSAYDDSLVIRSAESLGRMIGSLQRELDAARQMMGGTPTSGGVDGDRPSVRDHDTASVTAKKARAMKAGSGGAKSVKRATVAAKKSKPTGNGSRRKRSQGKSSRRT